MRWGLNALQRGWCCRWRWRCSVSPRLSPIWGWRCIARICSVSSGQVSFFASIAPICIAMGVPLEMLPLLLAVEVIPDIFRTLGNVTADLAVTRMVQGGEAEPDVAMAGPEI